MPLVQCKPQCCFWGLTLYKWSVVTFWRDCHFHCARLELVVLLWCATWLVLVPFFYGSNASCSQRTHCRVWHHIVCTRLELVLSLWCTNKPVFGTFLYVKVVPAAVKGHIMEFGKSNSQHFPGVMPSFTTMMHIDHLVFGPFCLLCSRSFWQKVHYRVWLEPLIFISSLHSFSDGHYCT